MIGKIVTFVLCSSAIHFSHGKDIDDVREIDPNGYVVYCPCMGRFGNQAEHFLGSLAFARMIDRTLILPPWVEYRPGYSDSSQIPFDTYFQVQSLKAYHRVVTMEWFMRYLASNLWPDRERYVFCWSPRSGPIANDCNAKDGNPFGPFWDSFNINFVGSQFFSDQQSPYDDAKEWRIKFPPQKYPVIALDGAPARFPMLEEHVYLQKYMKWSDRIEEKADNFIKSTLPEGPFIGLHFRNDRDWDNVCDLINGKLGTNQLFSSAQCLGYRNEHGTLNMQICRPDSHTIRNQVEHAVKMLQAKSVFVAADRDHMLDQLDKVLKKYNVKAYKLPSNDPHTDLAVLTKATHFIGNCVSSFSAFVKRYRDVENLPSTFWGMEKGEDQRSNEEAVKDEDQRNEDVKDEDQTGSKGSAKDENQRNEEL